MPRIAPALALLLASPLLDAQTCSTEVTQVSLDGGGSALRLTTPNGAPVVGGPFSLAVEGGQPGAPGTLFVGEPGPPTLLPRVGATIHPTNLSLVRPFTLDANGERSFFHIPALDPALCGVELVAQASVLDASAPGGRVVSNAWHLRVGKIRGSVFPNEALLNNGSLTWTAELVDLNQDGILDLVVPSFVFLNIRLGLGDGRFGPASIIQTSIESSMSAVADFNLDGLPDLVLGSLDLGKGAILLGNGDGTLQTPIPLAADRTTELAVGFMNGDNIPDLVVAEVTEHDVRILLGVGDGTFILSALIPLPDPRGVGLGDFDGDGNLDVAVADQDSLSVSILLGGGDGSLTYSAAYPADGDAEELLVVDLNADGVPDLATSNDFSDSISVLLGTGGGAFAPPVVYPLGDRANGIESRDFDADGHADLIVPTDTDLALLRGNGDGTLAPALDVVVSERSHDVAFGDVDGDGFEDLVVPNFAGTTVTVIADGKGGFIAPVIVETNEHLDAMVAADFDNDGDVDFAAARESGNLTVFPNDGNGGFEDKLGSPSGALGAQDLAAGDLDEDGVIDLVVGDNGELFTALGIGTGKFTPFAVEASGDFPTGLSTVDLDGDGSLDLLAVGRPLSTFGDELWIHPGLGDGTTAPPTVVTATLPMTAPAIGDVNGDGMLDVVTAAASQPVTQREILIFLGSASGLSAAVHYPTDNSSRAVELADLDEDGILDIVASAPGEVVVHRGVGDGSFEVLSENPTSAGSSFDIALGDVDGDGVLDIAFHDFNRIYCLLGTRNGRFGEPTLYTARAYINEVFLVDLDADGNSDFGGRVNGFGSDERDGLTVLLNRIGE